MSDFAGGAEATNPAETSQSFASQAPESGSSGGGYSAPPNEPRVSQPSQPTQTTRNTQGQFTAPSQAQPQAQFQGNAGGQFAGQSPGVLSALKASGYDVSGFQDDASFLGAMNSRLTAAEQYEKQIADYQRQLASRGQPLPGQFDRVQAHLNQPVDAKPGWSPPAYDPRNDQFFRKDEQSGRWVPNQPNVPYELVEAKNAYMEYREAFAKEWSNNPVETLWSRTEDRNRNLVREELKSLFSQMQVTKDTNDWLTKNAKVLFVDGQVDHSGDPAKLTEAGQLALQATEELDRAGVEDPATRRNFTERYLTAELSKKYFQEQHAQQQDPAQQRYSIQEIAQAIRMAQGLPPQQAAPTQPQMQPDPQYQPPQPAYAPPAAPQYEQPGVMTAQGWIPNPNYQGQYAPQQFQPQYQQPQPNFVPQQAWPQPQQQYAPTPEQVNQDQKRRFLGGVGHSASAGVNSGPSGEFVPQPSADGKANFLGIANQFAAARGVSL